MDIQIASEDLKLDMIPEAGDGQLIIFAHSFNPYKYWGSYEKSVDVAYEVTDKLRAGKLDDITLTDLRTLLFIYARSLRQIFATPNIELERLIVDALKKKISTDSIK